MDCYRITGLTLSLCLLTAAIAVSATLIQKPQNTAAVVGKSVSLTCESDTVQAASFYWGFAAVGTALVEFGDCQTLSSTILGYEIQLSGNSCILNISSLAEDQAGDYRCRSRGIPPENATSQVIVLESDPQCTTQPSGLVNMSDTVLMSCNVSCYGNTDTGPVMTWYSSTGFELSANNTGTNLSPNYEILVTSSIPTVLQHRCETRFTSTPPSVPGTDSATNVPSYTSTCYTKAITVQYPPFAENITVTPDIVDDFYIGSTLTCSAFGVPEISRYQWMNESEVIISYSSVLTLDQTGENLTYTCAVWNQLGTNKTDIRVNVVPVPVATTTSTSGPGTGSSFSDYPQSTTTSDCDLRQCHTESNNLGLALGLGLGLGIPLVIAIALNVILLNKLRVAVQYNGSKKSAKPKSGQSNGAYLYNSDVYNSDEALQYDDITDRPHVEHHNMNAPAAEPVHSPHYEVLKHTSNLNLNVSPYEQLHVKSNQQI